MRNLLWLVTGNANIAGNVGLLLCLGPRNLHSEPTLLSMGSLVVESIVLQLSGREGARAQVQAACIVVLLGFGLAKAVASVSAALQFIWRQYLRPGKKLTKYGKWAIVTGATDGIGRAYCDQLAKQGPADINHDLTQN